VLERLPASVLAARVRGQLAGLLVLALRAGTGVFLVGVGIGKLTDRASEIADFRHYGVPLPDLAVPLAGVIEIAGGVCVVLGFLTRPAAAVVALNLLVALLTAGVTDGGTFHLVVGPAVMLAMVVLVVSGAPPPSFDAYLLRRSEVAAPPPTARIQDPG
jgi:putative oxidoreductase